MYLKINCEKICELATILSQVSCMMQNVHIDSADSIFSRSHDMHLWWLF